MTPPRYVCEEATLEIPDHETATTARLWLLDPYAGLHDADLLPIIREVEKVFPAGVMGRERCVAWVEAIVALGIHDLAAVQVIALTGYSGVRVGHMAYLVPFDEPPHGA